MRFSIVAGDARFARSLGWALRLEAWRLRFAQGESIVLGRAERARADVLIYAFDRARFDDPHFADKECAAIRHDGAKVKVFLQLASPSVHGAARQETDRKNEIIAAMAAACGAHVVHLADLMQTGLMRRLTKTGQPNAYGYLAIAHVVLRAVKAQALRRTVEKGRASMGEKGMRAGARPNVEEAFAHLVWRQSHLPASLASFFHWESIVDFLNGQISFASHRSWGKLSLGDPIDWSMRGPNSSWQSYFNGLDFLRPVFAFWYSCASAPMRPQEPSPAERLRARGFTPDDCLRRASFIVADFVRRNPPDAPASQRAFAEGTVSRRVRVLLLDLLCCKKAEELGTPVDRDERDQAWQGLVDSLELLRSDEIYPKGNNHGVRQDALFVLVGLLFPDLAYARRLSRLGMDRLERHQFGQALSADGVWLENSFGYHCLVMNQLTALAADLRDAGAPASAAIHEVLRRMWPFAEGLIKCDGYAPLIGDTAPRYLFGNLAEVRRELDLASGNADPADIDLKTFERSKNTYYFPDAGYFASHTGTTMSDNSSSAIFCVSLSTPKHKQSDDLSLIFSRGARDLLVDGGTYNKEVSDTVRNAARFDPASHNTFRVNGAGYALRVLKGMRPAGLDESWQGDGWAAALGHNHAYPEARISRLVIHLKRQHAVIVLDKLASKTSAQALFEQFWHVSPDFSPPKTGGIWTSEHGNLLAAFDQGADLKIEHGGPDNPIAWLMLSESETAPTPYLRRAARMKEGIMASLFQSSDTAGEVSVQFAFAARNKVEISANGVGFACRFLAGGDRVECLNLDQRE
jgi:Heparinase II/III-like protein/Heparinase II/III N-terminus